VIITIEAETLPSAISLEGGSAIDASINSDQDFDITIDEIPLTLDLVDQSLQVTIEGEPGPQGPPGSVSVLPQSLADDTWDGPRANLQAGENLVLGDVCYINSSSKMVKADADAASTAGAMFIAIEAIATDASGWFGGAGGFLRDDTDTYTPGATLYLSTTPGELTETQPSGSGDQIQVMGHVYKSNIIYFYPSPFLLTHA
jgi:hypothetical protein